MLLLVGRSDARAHLLYHARAANSWPPRQQDSVTTDSDSTFARLGSTDDGEAIDDQFSSGDQFYETRMITMPHILQTRGPHCDPNSTATAGDVPAGSVLEKLGYAEYESYASSPGACALHVPVDCSDPSRALSDDTAHLGQDERATDGTEGENEIETQFGDAAMRVLETCEQLLSSSCGGCVDREHVLHEIGQLKKRYRCDLATRTQQASRCSIMRRSRRQERRHTLGMEARRVLKEWVDAHLEEPYPTIDGTSPRTVFALHQPPLRWARPAELPPLAA